MNGCTGPELSGHVEQQAESPQKMSPGQEHVTIVLRQAEAAAVPDTFRTACFCGNYQTYVWGILYLDVL